MRVCASVCVYVCTCGWEGGGGGSSDGVESVHEREDGVGGGGGCIQISVIMRAGTEPRCLLERKQFACALCICV